MGATRLSVLLDSAAVQLGYRPPAQSDAHIHSPKLPPRGSPAARRFSAPPRAAAQPQPRLQPQPAPTAQQIEQSPTLSSRIAAWAVPTSAPAADDGRHPLTMSGSLHARAVPLSPPATPPRAPAGSPAPARRPAAAGSGRRRPLSRAAAAPAATARAILSPLLCRLKSPSLRSRGNLPVAAAHSPASHPLQVLPQDSQPVPAQPQERAGGAAVAGLIPGHTAAEAAQDAEPVTKQKAGPHLREGAVTARQQDCTDGGAARAKAADPTVAEASEPAAPEAAQRHRQQQREEPDAPPPANTDGSGAAAGSGAEAEAAEPAPEEGATPPRPQQGAGSQGASAVAERAPRGSTAPPGATAQQPYAHKQPPDSARQDHQANQRVSPAAPPLPEATAVGAECTADDAVLDAADRAAERVFAVSPPTAAGVSSAAAEAAPAVAGVTERGATLQPQQVQGATAAADPQSSNGPPDTQVAAGGKAVAEALRGGGPTPEPLHPSLPPPLAAPPPTAADPQRQPLQAQQQRRCLTPPRHPAPHNRPAAAAAVEQGNGLPQPPLRRKRTLSIGQDTELGAATIKALRPFPASAGAAAKGGAPRAPLRAATAGHPPQPAANAFAADDRLPAASVARRQSEAPTAPPASAVGRPPHLAAAAASGVPVPAPASALISVLASPAVAALSRPRLVRPLKPLPAAAAGAPAFGAAGDM